MISLISWVNKYFTRLIFKSQDFVVPEQMSLIEFIYLRQIFFLFKTMCANFSTTFKIL